MNISVNDLIGELASRPRAELIEFVKQLDKRVAEWDFTLELHEHFAEQEKKYQAELAEEAQLAIERAGYPKRGSRWRSKNTGQVVKVERTERLDIRWDCVDGQPVTSIYDVHYLPEGRRFCTLILSVEVFTDSFEPLPEDAP